MPGNKIINSLWIGSKLSYLEILTIKSFLNNGHEFHLWTYGDVEGIPNGTILRNADNIIKKENIFSYKNNTKQGIGFGSYAGFSDIFRFTLLYKMGGWWTDMDITCLKYFDVEKPYFFPSSLEMKLTTNILKCPKNSVLMDACIKRAEAEITESNTDYTLPVKILNEEVNKLGLQNFIVKKFVTYDSYVIVCSNLNFNIPVKKDLHAIHWCNVLWSKYNINKNSFIPGSTYGFLIRKNNVDLTHDYVEMIRLNLMKKIQIRIFYSLMRNMAILIILKKIKIKLLNKISLWV